MNKIFNMQTIYPICLMVLVIGSCSTDELSNTNLGNNNQTCHFDEVDQKVWMVDNKTFLYGGEVDSMHFDISNWVLNKCNLKNGIGREKFQALLEPIYTPINNITNIPDTEKCLIVYTDIGVKVYPYVTMSFHEAVNESIDDHPICVAYCKLADLAVVYDRNICDTKLTYAVSGYTYSDEQVWDNTRSFLLWDRETESLWWPLLDMGVSGHFNGIEMKKYDESSWETLIFGEIKIKFPDAKVLDIQFQDIPNSNFKIPTSLIDC